MACGYCRTSEALWPVPLSDKEIANQESLHNIYIKDLYKNRNAIAKPFDDKILVLATCKK